MKLLACGELSRADRNPSRDSGEQAILPPSLGDKNLTGAGIRAPPLSQDMAGSQKLLPASCGLSHLGSNARTLYQR